MIGGTGHGAPNPRRDARTAAELRGASLRSGDLAAGDAGEAATPPANGSSDAAADARAFDELRGLLMGPEQQRLEKIQVRLEDPKMHAEDIAKVITEALKIRAKEDASVAQALAPTIDETLSVSIRERPQEIADSLSPIMMPAIRKSIFDTIKSMMQSLNETLERSMSVKGLKWRWEAMRTGKPFAEVVLLRTLQYRVEHVFLIHRETGLLLQHTSADAVGAAIEQPQAVSGMLTAIQDFVRDSFGADEDETLDMMQVGECTVRVERGPSTAVAAVVRGEPPQDLNDRLREAQRLTRTELGDELANFSGDPEPFAAAEPILAKCLVSARLSDAGGDEAAKPKKSLLRSPLFWGLFVVVALLIAWLVSGLLEGRRWDHFMTRVQTTPGLIVIHSETAGGYRLVGLRDPMARDPLELLRQEGFAAEDVAMSWQPFPSPLPEFVTARIHRVLEPPASVTVDFRDGVLRLSGEADRRWVSQSETLLRLVPEVVSVNFEELVIRPVQ